MGEGFPARPELETTVSMARLRECDWAETRATLGFVGAPRRIQISYLTIDRRGSLGAFHILRNPKRGGKGLFSCVLC